MEPPKEVDLPCWTIEDEGIVPEDETMTHEVLEAPAQEEIVIFPPPLVFMMFYLMMKEMRRR
jgi:hypothetical protein